VEAQIHSFNSFVTTNNGEEMTMAKQKHVLVVFSNPTPGQEDAYNDWYTNQHLDEVISTPGFVAAQRFKLNGETTLPGRYLAIYEMEHDNPPAAMEALTAAANSGAMHMSPAIDVAAVVTSIYTPITGRVAKGSAKGSAKGKKKAAKKTAKKVARKAAKKAKRR
jgi:hypothetical protein